MRKIRWLLLALAIVLFCTFAVWHGDAVVHNISLEREFVQAGEPYVPFAEVITDTYAYFRRNGLACGAAFRCTTEYDPQPFRLKVPQDVLLYDLPDEGANAHLVSAGDTITLSWVQSIWDTENCYPEFGFPAGVSGWRCCYLYVSGPERTPLGGVFYVKTQDVERLARTVFDRLMEHPGTPSAQKLQESFERSGLSREDYCSYAVHTSDRILYDAGKYISPDLYQPVFDTPAVLLLVGAGVSMGAFVVLSILQKKKR